MVKKAKKKAKKKATRKTTKKATRKTAKKATKKKAARGKKKGTDFIISKSRTKASAGLNVAGDFYGALDEAVREMICSAENRASANGRKTLRPQDL